MPSISNKYTDLVPNWWTNLYPFTYYFIGAYIKEYDVKLSTKKNLMLIVTMVIMFGTFNYYRNYNGQFKSSIIVDWGSIQNTTDSVLVFLLLLHLEIDKINEGVKWIITKVSEYSLGAYLVSWIFDSISYPMLNNKVAYMLNRLEYYLINVPFVFICSILLSCILDYIYKLIIYYFKKVKK